MNFRVQRSDYDFTDPDELTAQHRQPPPVAYTSENVEFWH